MLKKVLAVLLATIMVLTISACGSSQTGTTAAADTPVAAADTPVTLAVNHVGAVDHPYQAGCEKFAELAKEYSGGTITIEIYPASQLASGTKAVEMVQTGTLDICLEASTSLENFVPEVGVLNLPFMFANREEVKKVLNGDVGKKLEKYAEEKGFKILGWADNGFRCVSNSVRPIEKKDDYKGLKIRVPETEVMLKMYELLGATPTSMAVGEVYSAIQTGVVDGQDNTAANFVKNKYAEVQAYFTESNHSYTAEPFIMSMDGFNKLSANQQEALLKACKEACEYEFKVSADLDAEIIKSIKDSGVQIAEISPDALGDIQQAIAPIYEIKDGFYADLVKEIRTALGK